VLRLELEQFRNGYISRLQRKLKYLQKMIL